MFYSPSAPLSRRRFVLGSSALAVCVLAACDTPTTAIARAPLTVNHRIVDTGGPGGPPPVNGYPFSSRIGVDFYGYQDDTTGKRVAAQDMAAEGVGFARVTAYWYSLQQGADNTFTPWTLQPAHDVVNALQNAGLTPYIGLEATACFARSVTFPCSPNDVTQLPDSPEHWAAFKTYVQQMMQEFPTVQYWSIWNEPNAGFLISDGTSNRLIAYEQIVDSIAPIIRAAGRKVLAPELGDGTDATNGLTPQAWLTAFLQHDGSLVDIVAVHSYGATEPNGPLAFMSQYSSILDSYAPQAELWLTEAGYPIGTPTDSQLTHNVNKVYLAMLNNTLPRWTKTFYWSAGVHYVDPEPTKSELRNLYSNFGNPVTGAPRAAMYCLAFLAKYGTYYYDHGPCS